jgi:iron complex transport system substrate-binding protein
MKASAILAGIAMTMLLLALPVVASDDYTLGVFGNANEDETINMQDVTYTELIILEYRDRTELSDAKYDGKINMQDVTQIELVILGKEKELTVLDSVDRVVTIDKPVERVIPMYHGMIAAVKSLGAEDKVIAVSEHAKEETTFFPEICKLPSVGMECSPDYEMIIALEPDVYIEDYWAMMSGEIEEKLEPAGIAVVCLNFFSPGTAYTEEVKKLGYILGEKDRADEYIGWYEGYLDTIAESVEGLSEDDKPRVFGYYGGHYGYGDGPPYGTFGKDNFATGALIKMAGGINIAGELPGDWITVEAEWVLDQNPSIIFRKIYDRTILGYDVDDPSGACAVIGDIMSQPAFKPTDAVKEGKVCIHCGLDWFIQATYMAKWFHPDLFDDLDPQAVHQEYLTEFQGLDYDLSERGVFVYPPLKPQGGTT